MDAHWINRAIDKSGVECELCRVATSKSNYHDATVHQHLMPWYALIGGSIYQAQSIVKSNITISKGTKVRSIEEMNTYNQRWSEVQSKEISQLRFPIDRILERFMRLEKSPAESTDLKQVQQREVERMSAAFKKFSGLKSPGQALLYIKASHAILKAAYRNGGIRFKDTVYAAARAYFAGQTINIKKREKLHNSSSTLSLTLYPVIECSEIDSLFLENITYKIVNPLNIKFKRDFKGAKILVIDPKKFDAHDSKYLALWILYRTHNQILGLIEQKSEKVSFLFDEDLPRSQPDPYSIHELNSQPSSKPEKSEPSMSEEGRCRFYVDVFIRKNQIEGGSIMVFTDALYNWYSKWIQQVGIGILLSKIRFSVRFAELSGLKPSRINNWSCYYINKSPPTNSIDNQIDQPTCSKYVNKLIEDQQSSTSTGDKILESLIDEHESERQVEIYPPELELSKIRTVMNEARVTANQALCALVSQSSEFEAIQYLDVISEQKMINLDEEDLNDIKIVEDAEIVDSSQKTDDSRYRKISSSSSAKEQDMIDLTLDEDMNQAGVKSNSQSSCASQINSPRKKKKKVVISDDSDDSSDNWSPFTQRE